jgi:hypothetical protein
VRLTYHPRDSKILLSAGANLPTGKTELTDSEALVSRALSNQFLGFRTNRSGEGLDLFGNAFVAWPVSRRWSLGAGAGFTKKGSYEYASESANGLGEIAPGDEISVSGGLSYLRRGELSSKSLNLDLSYRAFGSDEVEGVTLFEEGDEFEIFARGALDTERWRWDARVRAVMKSDNAFVGSAVGWSAPDTLENLLLSNITGDYVETGAGVMYRLTPRWDLGARVAFDRFGAVEVVGGASEGSVAARGAARVLEIGPAMTWRPSRRFALTLGVSALSGSAEDGDVSLGGFDIGIGTDIQF